MSSGTPSFEDYDREEAEEFRGFIVNSSASATDFINRTSSPDALRYLVEDADEAVPKDDVFGLYTDWAEAHGIDDPLNKSWFTRKLNTHIEVDSTKKRIDGEPVPHYTGVRIRSEEDFQP